MDSPEQPIAEPPSPPPDLLARARAARAMVLALGVYFALRGSLGAVHAFRMVALISRRSHDALLFLPIAAWTLLAVLCAAGLLTFNPTARRWVSTVSMAFGIPRLLYGLLTVYCMVLARQSGFHDQLSPTWPHSMLWSGVVDGCLRGAVDIFVSCYLRTSLVVFLFDRVNRPVSDATMNQALAAGPSSVLDALRTSSMLAVARSDVGRPLLIGFCIAVGVLLTWNLGIDLSSGR